MRRQADECGDQRRRARSLCVEELAQYLEARVWRQAEQHEAHEARGEARDRCRLALEQLTGVPPARRQARFRCCVTAVGGDGRVIAAEGVCPGRISTEPRGANGFGYDPIFYFSALQRTMAELSPEVKNRISHRAAAIRRIATRLVAGFPDLKAD